jgi:CO/xanthine dehydrogenase Mo-binding subunit
MHPFTLGRPLDLASALVSRAQAGRNDAAAEYIAGGTDMGEIAMVGVAPAITNAIFHATGKRIRQLPVTPDKLL